MASRRRILIRVGIVLAVLVAAHIVWTYVEKSALQARVESLRQAGDPIYLTDLAMPTVPDDRNGVKLLEEATAWLEKHGDEEKGAKLWHGLYRGAEDWEEQDREQAAAYLAKLAPYYAMLHEVPRRPRWWLDMLSGDDPFAALSVIPQVQEAVEHTHYRVAFDRVVAGRTERAARAAILLLDLADRCELPFAIGHLVIGVVRDSDEILRLAEKQPGFDARLFRELVDPRLARTVQRLGPPTAPLKEERALALWVTRALLAGDALEHWDDRILGNALWRPMLYRDACRMLDTYERAIAECGVTPEDAHAIAIRLREEQAEVSVVYPLTRAHSAVSAKLFNEYTASTAKRRLTRVVMALLEYRQTRGEWPQDLTPLGTLPLDPYSGAPFLYERRGKGARIRPAHDFGFTEGDIWKSLVDDERAWSWEE